MKTFTQEEQLEEAFDGINTLYEQAVGRQTIEEIARGGSEEVILLKPEKEYFEGLYLKTFREEDETLTTVVESAKITIELHSALEDIQSAPENGIFASLMVTAKFVPPLRAALGGFLGLIEIYQTLTESQHWSSTAFKVGLGVIGIALGVGVVVCPPAALVLGFVGMGIGLIRDGHECYETRQDLQPEMAELKKLHALYQKCVDPKRKEILTAEIVKQANKVKKAEDECTESYGNFVMGVASVLGGLLLMTPPFTFVGVAIIAAIIAIKVAPKLKSLGEWVVNKVSLPKQTFKPSAVVVEKKVEDRPDFSFIQRKLSEGVQSLSACVKEDVFSKVSGVVSEKDATLMPACAGTTRDVSIASTTKPQTLSQAFFPQPHSSAAHKSASHFCKEDNLRQQLAV